MVPFRFGALWKRRVVVVEEEAYRFAKRRRFAEVGEGEEEEGGGAGDGDADGGAGVWGDDGACGRGQFRAGWVEEGSAGSDQKGELVELAGYLWYAAAETASEDSGVRFLLGFQSQNLNLVNGIVLKFPKFLFYCV